MNRTERNGGGTSKTTIMNKEIVLDLISVLSRSNNETLIYEALVKLRTDLIQTRAGCELFQECEGIPPLVRLIGKPYERILDVTLSILVNCCTTKTCCEQAIFHGVVPSLLTILERTPSTSVQCRVCRLIGNLARESNEKIRSIVKSIGIAIAKILKNNKDVKTLNMAVRAARLLWNERLFKDSFRKTHGVEIIIAILLRYTQIEQQEPQTEQFEPQTEQQEQQIEQQETQTEQQEPQIEPQDPTAHLSHKLFIRDIQKNTKPPPEESFKLTAIGGACKDLNDLFTEILRSLQIFTNSYRVIRRLCEYDCKCFVLLAKHDSPFRAQALKILLNLSKCPNDCLSRADAVTTACSLITLEDLQQPLSQVEEKYCISIICFYNGRNVEKMFMSGAFTRIMEIYKNTKCDTVLMMILFGLRSFKYNNTIIDLLIQMGLIDLLAERLDLCTRDFAKIVASKPASEIDGIWEKLYTIVTDQEPRELFRSYYPDKAHSPDSSSLIPDISDDMVVTTIISVLELHEECRHDENEDFDDATIQSADEDVDGNDDNVDDNSDENIVAVDSKDSIKKAKLEKNDKSATETMKKLRNTIDVIIEILHDFSVYPPFCDVCIPGILDALFRMLSVVKLHDDHDGIPSILSRLCSLTTNNILLIIEHDYAFKLYKMTKILDHHEGCLHCNKMREVKKRFMYELYFWEEEITHIFPTSDEKMQKKIAVFTTYFFEISKYTQEIFFEHGGLNIIMEIILSRDAKLSAKAAIGLTLLANKLNIAVPSSDGCSIGTGRFDPARRHVTDADVAAGHVVTFIAGPQTADADIDQPTVQFNETTLTDASDVFSTMLKNNFRESIDKRIYLPKQTLLGIQYFLDALQQRSVGNGLLLADAKYMKAVLETYDMCQMYMLRELERDIYNLISCMLSDETVLCVFEFAMANHKQDLLEVAINYYLCAKIAGDRKVAMYRATNISEYFWEWNQMMTETVGSKIELRKTKLFSSAFIRNSLRD